MTLDVVIPTYRRPDRCRQAVASVLDAGPEVNVIVVDQGENLNVGRIESPLVKYIHLEKPGLPHARNVGIVTSTADIVLFMDDDAEMHSGCIEEHLRRHQSDERIGIVAGRIRQAGAAQWADVSTVSTVDSRTGTTTGNFDLDFDGPIPYATGGHFSVKRSVLYRSGLFDARFRGPALFEDVDFSFRMRRCGYIVSYASSALVTHYSKDIGGCHAGNPNRRLFDRIHNHALFYGRHIQFPPTLEFLTEMRNIAEYASRTDTGRHNPTVLFECFVSLLSGLLSGLSSRYRDPVDLSFRHSFAANGRGQAVVR